MKKKIKDLTLEELFIVCNNTYYRDCMFGTCPLARLCVALNKDISEASEKIKDIYECEVDVE